MNRVQDKQRSACTRSIGSSKAYLEEDLSSSSFVTRAAQQSIRRIRVTASIAVHTPCPTPSQLASSHCSSRAGTAARTARHHLASRGPQCCSVLLADQRQVGAQIPSEHMHGRGTPVTVTATSLWTRTLATCRRSKQSSSDWGESRAAVLWLPQQD